MSAVALAAVAAAVLLVLYSYVGYPLILRVFARPDSEAVLPASEDAWPSVSITIPVYNEAAQIREMLQHVLQVEYPRDRLQILVVSDASTDGTDDIVRTFASEGVELRRMPVRKGKTAAENAVAPLLRGDIVVNTDASVRMQPDAVRRLVAAFTDPRVGLASGRDVSVTNLEERGETGESGYVGYEMGIRALETRAGGIIGASGCLYAIRGDLHRTPLPENLSRDFASALVTREHGYRAVSVDDAVCFVPRTPSLQREYRRKVRTMVRGMRTLFYKRRLLDPFRYGLFAWKLFSHKICRWLAPWAVMAGALGALVLTAGSAVGLAIAGVVVVLASVAALAWLWPADWSLPRVLALPAFAVWSNLAAVQALVQAPGRRGSSVWEPTRRNEIRG